MKTSLLVGLLLATAVGAHAQQSPATAPGQPAKQQPAATDAWDTEAKPAATSGTDITATPTDAIAVPAAGTVDTKATIDAEAPKPSNGLGAVKPLNPQPKLNPNSSGTYDKKMVKKQGKHSDKVVAKRRRVTYRNADYRRADQIRGIRRMEKGKIANSASMR